MEPKRGGRSTPRLIADTFGLYRRYPWLFLVLAAAVIVPYDFVLLGVTGEFGGSAKSPGIEIPLSFFYLFVIAPLVSALHIHAVSDVRRGDEPRLLPVARRGLATLPVVCAATIMAWLGTIGGLLLLVVPGVVLWIRWFVAAQVAAIERTRWEAALRRSWSLTEGGWGHVLVFFVCIAVLTSGPSLLLNLAFRGDRTGIVPFAAHTALEVILVSFTALATALLYYDLRARREALATENAPATDVDDAAAAKPLQESNDPRVYSDLERPNGWYVDPDRPNRMLYWDGTDPPGWRGETRTPRKLRARWEEHDG